MNLTDVVTYTIHLNQGTEIKISLVDLDTLVPGHRPGVEMVDYILEVTGIKYGNLRIFFYEKSNPMLYPGDKRPSEEEKKLCIKDLFEKQAKIYRQ